MRWGSFGVQGSKVPDPAEESTSTLVRIPFRVLAMYWYISSNGSLEANNEPR